MQKLCPPSHFFVPFLLAAASVALLGASASAQSDFRSRLRPITSPLRHAGVYHVATGTWTRNGSLANLTGPDTIYNNTCTTGGYFALNVTGEKFQHRSRVPTTAANGAPTQPSVFYGPPRRDQSPGCTTSYLVNGFQIGYCSSRPSGQGPFDDLFEFANAYASCGAADMTPTAGFNITGLPGGTVGGTQNCWIVDIDLGAASTSFVLAADQDGTWTGPSSAEQFGYSQGITTAAITSLDATGPIIAGNFTWTGGAVVGGLSPCTGTDGTIWDSPVNLAEQGTGMTSNDFFRVTGPTPSVPRGCYAFGGTTLHADFYLKLYCNAGCPSPGPGITFCEPGIAGVLPCPYVNPPAGPGRGCNNSNVTGGATLTDTGTASLAADTVVFTTTDERPNPISVVWGGTADIPSGLPFSAGIRCFGGAIRRLYTKVAVAGSITAPSGPDPSVSARSAALGSPIIAGQTRYYQVSYRERFILCPGCGTYGTSANTSAGRKIIWNP